MKTLKILVAAGLTLASVSSIAGVDPGTGIKLTKHDWSGSARAFLLWCPATGCTGAIDPVTGVAADATTYQATGYVKALKADGTQGKAAAVSIGMCTTCHTPHQARSNTLLWNHTLLNTEYSWESPKTTAGTEYPTFQGDTYKGASTKCLSCHDGLMSSTDGMWFNRKRVTTAAYVSTNPRTIAEDSGHHVAHHDDMSASHPVAFPYPFGQAPNAYNGTATGDQIEVSEFEADPTAAGIRLFNDDGTGNIIAGPVAGSTGMECTSCHDVHNGKNTKDVMLLRGKLTGSDQASGYICTQCHKK